MNEKLMLQELGFTEGEIKVYLALFDLGESTVGPISKKSGVTHAKVYPILNKLIEKGLVSHVIKEGRQNFSATSPNSLLEFVNKKIGFFQEEKEKIKEIIPGLITKQKTKEGTQYARVFEGFKGLRALFRELFENNEEKTEICVLGLNEILKRDDFRNFFLYYHDLRKKNKKIRLKLILNSNMKVFFDKNYRTTGQYNKPDEVKFVNIVFPTGVFIFKEHVINIVAGEKITAFDIKSEENSENYRKFFNEIWNKRN